MLLSSVSAAMPRIMSMIFLIRHLLMMLRTLDFCRTLRDTFNGTSCESTTPLASLSHRDTMSSNLSLMNAHFTYRRMLGPRRTCQWMLRVCSISVLVRGQGLLGPVAAVHLLLRGSIKDVMGTGDPWGITDAVKSRRSDGRLEKVVGRRLFCRGLACNWQAVSSHKREKRDS